jgi:elongation factor Ts
MNQPFVKNDKLSVAEYLKQAKTTVKSFELYVVGEGLEKKQDNFVAEVQAAQDKVQAAAAAATK